MLYVAYLCGWGKIDEPLATMKFFLVPALRTQIKGKIALVAMVVVVQTQRLGMVGQRVPEEEDKGVVVVDPRKQRPGCGLGSIACQSYDSALPGMSNDCQWGPNM